MSSPIARILATVGVVAGVTLLSGCFPGEPDGPIAVAVEDQLRPYEADGIATVDFDQLVDGDWTRLALVCGKSSADEIEAAFGFGWQQPDREDVRARSAFVFLTDEAVEQFFGTTTAAPFDDRTYVSSCGPGGNVLIFDRSESTVTFTLRPNTEKPLWTVAGD